jgi:hypothetical protein
LRISEIPNNPSAVDAKGEIILTGSSVNLSTICHKVADVAEVLALSWMNNKTKKNPRGSIIAPIIENLDIRLFGEPLLVNVIFFRFLSCLKF